MDKLSNKKIINITNILETKTWDFDNRKLQINNQQISNIMLFTNPHVNNHFRKRTLLFKKVLHIKKLIKIHVS